MTDDNKVFYKCDPSKNNVCRKAGCFINGGTCKRTTHRKFRMYRDKGMTWLQIRKKAKHVSNIKIVH